MGIIVDLIIIVVVLLFIFLGYKKGLTGSLIKLLSFIIAIVVAFVLYKPVANAVIENTVIDDNIRTTLSATLGVEDKTENINSISTKIPVICFDANHNKNLKGNNIYRAYSWYDVYYKYLIIKEQIKDEKN